MNKKPVLVVMAAGMGSRYGGLKQIDPVDAEGDKIIDFSVYDAVKAGFGKVIFIIKKEMEDVFREAVGERMSRHIEVEYAFQDVANIPEGYSVPDGRTKPWGTAHAVLSAKDLIDGPFAVINADDFYGREAFELIYNYLTTHEDDDKFRYAMVAFLLRNTVTEHGTVSRGVCTIDSEGKLQKIQEYTKIAKRPEGIYYTDGEPAEEAVSNGGPAAEEDSPETLADGGLLWHRISGETMVSMNMLGFSKSLLNEIESGFPAFLDKGLAENPMKCEYYLPSVITELLDTDKATMEVLTTREAWYGVTYQEDKAAVSEAIAQKKATGIYPQNLWD